MTRDLWQGGGNEPVKDLQEDRSCHSETALTSSMKPAFLSNRAFSGTGIQPAVKVKGDGSTSTVRKWISALSPGQ